MVKGAVIRLSVSPCRLRLGLFPHFNHNKWGKPAEPMLHGGIDLTFKPNFFQSGFRWPKHTEQLRHFFDFAVELVWFCLAVGIYRLFRSCAVFVCCNSDASLKVVKWKRHLRNQSTEILFAIDQKDCLLFLLVWLFNLVWRFWLDHPQVLVWKPAESEVAISTGRYVTTCW